MSNTSISLFAELATDFQDRYKVSRETAARLVGLFATAAATSSNEADAEASFQKLVTEDLAAGKPWAGDYFRGYISTTYPQAAAICEAAVKAGTDPIAALQAVYGVPAQLAAELAQFSSTNR
ncbi:hypothetical protein ACIPY6_28590 [Streptomyces sp. NPDC090054]|uniref:hypothetical protein n=1 Tax=Streptomyces sp. NPDC090054 TaxID=3365933 RepID=UPI003805F45F